MICFLTSSIVIPGTETLNPANGFIRELRRYFPQNGCGLFICSDPDDTEKADFYTDRVRESLEDEGLRFRRYRILDGRNEAQAGKLIEQSDLIVLAGGHVPTQNRFFQKIRLKNLLKEYNGGKPVTYHVSFWDDDAEYFMNHVEKNDSIEVSGFVFQIKDIGKGPFIEIRGCKLHSINNIKLIAVEDIPSLLQRGAERHGRKA